LVKFLASGSLPAQLINLEIRKKKKKKEGGGGGGGGSTHLLVIFYGKT
jgi:hypothetical protein